MTSANSSTSSINWRTWACWSTRSRQTPMRPTARNGSRRRFMCCSERPQARLRRRRWIFTPSKQHFDLFNLSSFFLLIKHPWESLFIILNCLRIWILNTKTAIWTWRDRCLAASVVYLNIITDYQRQKRLPSLPAWTSTWNKEISTEIGYGYSECHRNGKSTVESNAKRNPRLFNSEETLKMKWNVFQNNLKA